MRLFLIFHGRFPSEKAASLFAAKSAEAFANQGIEVILLVPKRNTITDVDPCLYYSVKNNFKLIYLPIIDLFRFTGLSHLAFWTSYFTFSLSVRSYLKKYSDKDDIVYSNEILPLIFISKIRKNCFYEMHDFPESKIGIFGKYLSRMRWILIHNRWKLKEAKRLFPYIDDSKYLYEPNAVDLKDFDIDIDRDSARKKLSLPLNKTIVVYTGHLYGWKGVDTLAESAKLLPNNYLVVFVGGTDLDVRRFKDNYERFSTIRIIGQVKHSEIPIWQKAGDILILPNTAKEKISAYYTSPMKLFEYMASKRPVIATKIPSILEILNEKNSILVEADYPQKMKEVIIKTGQSIESCKALATQAFVDVEKHTWDKRAERIKKFIDDKFLYKI